MRPYVLGNTGIESAQPISKSAGMMFESEGGLGGFQPMGASSAGWGFQGGSPNGFAESGVPAEEYLDDEERERVEKVITDNEERKRALF